MGEQDMAPALQELTKEKRDTDVGHRSGAHRQALHGSYQNRVCLGLCQKLRQEGN